MPASEPIAHPQIALVSISALRTNPRNARKHPAKQIEQLAAAIDKFGWLVPIITDETGMIVAGHGRLEAAKALKLKEVPTIRAEFLTDADRRAFILAENRIAQLAGWDSELLNEELSYFLDIGYDLEITGFTVANIDFAIDAAAQTPEQVELPDPAIEAVSRSGDLWQIGQHRLYNGDALEVASYEALLGGETADMVFADPPYNVPIAGHVSGLGKKIHREFAQASGEMTKGQFTGFLRGVFRNLARFSQAASIHYHCMDWRHMREMLDAADGVYSQFKQLVVWNKGQGAMGTFYRSQHELVFVFKSGSGRHINNFGLGEKGRVRTNVWDYAGANTFRKGRAKDLEDHPTVKPTAMVLDAIRDCSHRGDLILDPFCGSGTTLIAAHRAGRRGAGIELDPVYVDVALRRMRDASGLEAVLAGDGRTFTEIAAERRQQPEA